MPVASINGQGTDPDVSSISFTDANVSCDLRYPTGRLAANGNRPIHFVGIGMVLAGRGASRSVRLGIGSVLTSAAHSIAAGSSAVYHGRYAIDAYSSDADAQLGTVKYTTDGSTYFGRSSYSSSDLVGYPPDSAGRTLVGDYEYDQVPTAPGAPVISNVTAGGCRVVSAAPSDNGGSSVVGYRLQRATNSAFTTGLVTTDGTTGTFDVSGLSPGTKYWFRVAARNSVTEHYSTSSVYSAVTSVTLPSGGKVYVQTGTETVFGHDVPVFGWVQGIFQVRNASGIWVPANLFAYNVDSVWSPGK